MKTSLTVAVWSVNLSFPVSRMEDWAALVERQMLAAKSQGASVLLMPEYASEQWLHFAGRKLKATEQLGWMADQVKQALPLLQALSQKHDMLLASGTFSCHLPGATPPLSNRAHVFFPDGRLLTQDKLCLTPKEKNPEGWHLSTGTRIQTFMWQGWKIAVFICLDIELPALSAKMAPEAVDLVLVPSMTKTEAGYHRVYDCAKARAIELQAAIAVCGTIGHGPARNANISGASFYLPCEEKFGSNGILARIAPVRAAEGPGPLLVAVLPLGEIRALRENAAGGGAGAEVWPGNWDATPVEICRNG